VDNFSEWLKLQEGLVDAPKTPDQARRHDLVGAGLGDGLEPSNPMHVQGGITSAFPTYGGKPLPGNKKAKLKKS
jgi:hypothetical protein